MSLVDYPLVSVRLMVYNNEPFIREAIESILMQNTEFKVEIVVGDDFSTDNTLKIIRSYESTKKIKIKILDRPVGGEYWCKRKNKNASVRTNFMDIVENCSGKYIAFLDGDDYWADPLKLQKQVSFLEQNTDFGICFHNVAIYDQENNKLIDDNITREVKETTDIIELANGNYIHTPSVMLRNDFVIPDWFEKSPIGDWTLYMIVLKEKKIKKLKEVMSVYRTHDTSIWSRLSQEAKINRTLTSVKLVLENLELPVAVKGILMNIVPDKSKKLKRINTVLNRVKKFLRIL
ncbi:MAG: hypothetical protein COA67_00575 [Lutibacter sp.]|nr:MAG: hypothetical protein COA67_00575 [Lutibacter sp.]